ncbi:putative cytochrome P450 [Helianthus debilis subsp. tardiflorus]
MSEMARSIRVTQKLQTEIQNQTRRKTKVDVSDITNMTYLKMGVKETLRLHAPAPLLIPHECMSHCQIGGSALGLCGRCHRTGPKISRGPKLFKTYIYFIYTISVDRYTYVHPLVQWM